MIHRVLLVLLVLIIASAGAFPAQAATTVIVNPGSMNGWAFAQENQPTGSGSMVTGPAPVPMGSGSAQLSVDSTGQEIFYTTAFAGTSLSSLTSLQYSAYRSTPDAGNNLAISLQFDVNYDIRGGGNANEGRLVFEPYRTPGVGGTISEDTWFTWNALNGRWWATKKPGSDSCSPASPCTWAQVLSAFPYAGIRGSSGSLLFKAGGPWAGGFSGNVDAFTIGISGAETTYDFELETGNPPDTSIDSSNPPLTNNPVAEFAFSGTDDFTPPEQLTFECQLDGSPWEACTSPAAFNNLLDGSHTFQVRAQDPAGLVDPSPASHTWEIDTQAPAAKDLKAAPDPALPGSEVGFSATIDDTGLGDHSITSAEYSSNGLDWISLPAEDGAFDSPTELVAGSLTAPAEGTFELCVRGSDAAGNTGDPTCTTLTVDAPPTVEAGGPYGGQEGSPVSLLASATDDPGSTLTVLWSYTPGGDVDNGASCTFGDPNALETTISCDDDGTYTLQVSADDGANPPVSAQAELILNNTAPQVEISSPVEGEEFKFGDPVNFQTILSDPGANDTFTCQIDWGDGGQPDNSPDCLGQHTYAAYGDYTIQVTVSDDDGSAGSAQVSIHVNGLPTAGAGGPYQGTEGQAVQLQGSASDPEPDTLAILWSYTPGGDVDPGASCTFSDPALLDPTVTCDDEGTFTLEVSVDDGVNPPVTAQAELILGNAGPQVEIASPSDGAEFVFGEAVQVEAGLTDPGANDTHSCAIDWGDGGQPEVQPGCDDEHTYSSAGQHTIVVAAEDDDGGSGSTQVTITILEETNQPPSASAGGPYNGKEGQPVALQGSASDPDQDPLSYSWSYQAKTGVKPGTACSFGNLHALKTSFTCNDNGTFELTLSASDGHNAPVSIKTTVTIANQAPTVMITRPAAVSEFFAGTPVDLTAIYQEIAAHDTVSCQIDWGQDALALLPELSGSCQGSHTYALPGTYTIAVTALDDDGGEGSASVTVTVIEEVDGGNWVFMPVVVH